MKRHLIRAVKRWGRSAGIEFARYHPFLELITARGATVVLDIGANVGQYARELRASGYRGRIVSFEPVAACYQQLSAAAASDPDWQAVHVGVGEANGESVIEVGRDTRMSSLLRSAAADSVERRETIRLVDLHTAVAGHATGKDRVFCKLDTQGYEMGILGAADEETLGRIDGFQIELAVTPTYLEQPTFESVVSFLRERGFVLWTTRRGLYDPHLKRELEFDALFFRESPVSDGKPR